MGGKHERRRAWIEIDYIYQIFQEDGYRRISRNELTIGDVVLYKHRGEPSHVGIVAAIDFVGTTPTIRVMSKWGGAPEFVHVIDSLPVEFGIPAEYWTDRVSDEPV